MEVSNGGFKFTDLDGMRTHQRHLGCSDTPTRIPLPEAWLSFGRVCVDLSHSGCKLPGQSSNLYPAECVFIKMK